MLRRTRSLLLLCVASLLRAQSVALTFDDGPDLPGLGAARARALNAGILKALADAKVKSVLFASGKRVDSPEGWELVKAWGAAGNLVANHTYTHPYLHSKKLELKAFEADAARMDALLQPIPGFTRLLRFPFLKEGDTAEKRDGMRAWMKAHGYRNGAVTIDASDWYYDARFAAWRAAHPGADPAPFRQAYLDHLWDRARYYEGLAQALGRKGVKHTLLLHTNEINAAFLPDVIAMFRAKGWKVVDAREAFEDPLFRVEPDILPAGESLLWSLAKQKGLPGLRYPAEDDVYEKPLLDARGL
ncbi:MAG: polysaccharide deacetylase family protein [Holophagaceae bacterium]